MMPMYAYSHDGTEVHWRFHKLPRPRKFIRVNGEKIPRCIMAEHSKRHAPVDAGWPRKSWAAGVTLPQVGEAIATDKKLGVPTTYDRKTGQAIFNSASHQKRWLNAHGWSNWDSYD